MNRVIPIDYRPWSESSANEIGYAGLEDTTNVHTYTHEDGTSHDVLVIDSRENKDGPTILKSASLNYRIDPLLIRQETILAHKLGARVALAELPGVSELPLTESGLVDTSIDIDQKISAVQQTRKEFLEISRGRFDLVAQKQLIALTDILGLSEGDTVELHGHSLGAMVAATMGRVAAKHLTPVPLSISRIHLDDPSNVFNTSAMDFARLVKSSYKETARRNELYLNENIAIGHGDVTAFDLQSVTTKAIDRYIKSRQRPVVINSLRAMRKGIAPIIDEAIHTGLQTGSITPNTIVSSSHYRDSLVSNIADHEALAEQVRSHDVQTEIFEYVPADDDRTELGHLAGTSLGRTAAIAAMTKRH